MLPMLPMPLMGIGLLLMPLMGLAPNEFQGVFQRPGRPGRPRRPRRPRRFGPGKGRGLEKSMGLGVRF